jgi:hypothetical protein
MTFVKLGLAGNETMIVTGLDGNGNLHQHSPLEAQLQATLNTVPAHAWYALPNGALTFVNERSADYLGLPKGHPLRFGTGTGADSDSLIPLLHADDREETRRVWSDCLRTRWAKHMDPFVLHVLAGHTDMNTTKRYIHPDETHILEAMSKVRGGHTSGHTDETSDPKVVFDSSSIYRLDKDLTGATRRDRTGDLLITNQPLYQLS